MTVADSDGRPLLRTDLFGPIDSPTYGCDTPPASPDEVTGLFQKYHIMGTLALCSLGLDDFDHHGTSPRFADYVLPICLSATTYYAEHYRKVSGKLDLFATEGNPRARTWLNPDLWPSLGASMAAIRTCFDGPAEGH